MKTSKKKFPIFPLVLAYIVFSCITTYNKKQEVELQELQKQIEIQNCFREKIPISINGYIWQNSKKSSISISIKNNSNYVVSAVSFLLRCYNVYGEEMLYSPFKAIYQKNYIACGENRKIEYNIPHYTKLVEIYVYSVYYKNNSQKEWGTRNIKMDELYKYAPVSYVEYIL